MVKAMKFAQGDMLLYLQGRLALYRHYLILQVVAHPEELDPCQPFYILWNVDTQQTETVSITDCDSTFAWAWEKL